jgi:DNA-binding MarR family transcriptional regulator
VRRELKSKHRVRRAKRSELPSRLGVHLSDRLAHLVKDTSKLLARALQSRLNEHSIAYGHWTFLRILWKHNGISQTRLSQLAGVMAPSTFAAVGAMERLGYVVRRQKPSNRKNVYIFLTPAGRALEAELVPLAVAVNNIAVSGLTRNQIAEFRKVLIAIIGNFET